MYPVLFKVGTLTVYTYGFFIFLGVTITYWLSAKEAVREGIDEKVFSGIFFWSLLAGFLGARLLYLIVEWNLFTRYPFRVLFGRSGFVFYGGLISGIITFYLFSRRNNLAFLKLADLTSLYLPLGHVLGRLGCFFYGCCYGKPTRSWLGLLFPPSSPAGLSGEKVIPTQLISSAALLFIFFVLKRIKKKRKFRGQIMLSYLLLYGVFRFIIEFFRGDPRGGFSLGGVSLSTSQYISLAAVLAVIFLWRKIKRTA